jgi:hypothetical protein
MRIGVARWSIDVNQPILAHQQKRVRAAYRRERCCIDATIRGDFASRCSISKQACFDMDHIARAASFAAMRSVAAK